MLLKSDRIGQFDRLNRKSVACPVRLTPKTGLTQNRTFDEGQSDINTTYGPIDIELWPKEAPKAVRNFVQLCLEGYFDNTIFHRIIKGFLVQGGDPTGSGTGNPPCFQQILWRKYLREYVFGRVHSRLRFNHRGIIACANAGTPHSNGSYRRLYINLLRIGEVDTDQNDRPLDPPPKINLSRKLNLLSFGEEAEEEERIGSGEVKDQE
ncbi:Peptidyl-prolyl cis-trans isomerase CYP57 [Hibiscus syriacus]|uniref:Peptidyl-prolyl cis-trans isomerase n=1 Tax=Hibiscus syriacus TaxID=106335 RepID=A0A6A3D0D0_HIBSY|nr:Peptidyl-prolyl cis-trans isomerase CYP57 [Hibiscus syriacus]